MNHDYGPAFDLLPGLVWTALPDGRIDFVNKGWLEYAGVSVEEVLDHRWRSTVHPDDQPTLMAAWEALLKSAAGGELTARLRRSDGEYRWFLFRANPITESSGEVVRWYGVNTEIDELKRSEAFLAESERLSKTGSLFWRLEPEEIIVSKGMRRLLDLPDGDVTLERIASRFHPDDMRIFSDTIDVARQGMEISYETRFLMSDGSLKYMSAIGHLIQNQHGPLEYFAAAQDVTELRLSEQALDEVRSDLAHAARVTSLGALAASVVHEVNQPLSGIITNAGTCQRMLAADPPNIAGAQETARRMVRDSNRAADITKRLRALFTKKGATFETVDLNEAAREVIALCLSDLQRRRVILRSEFASDLPYVRADRIQLQQVVLNLLLNAADAMNEVEERPRQVSINTGWEEAGHVRVAVQDAGIGLEPQVAEKLFEAFFTTKSEGMGIGLSVSRTIIENHGGRIWAEPNEGPGATFTFTLPSTSPIDKVGGSF